MVDEVKKETPAYNKMPLWQWVVVYVLVATIIYGLFYAFVMFKNQGKSPSYVDQIQEQETNLNVDPDANSDKDVAEIELTEAGFSPDMVTVSVGTTVTWTNNTDLTATVNSADHPTNLLYPALNLGEMAPGGSVNLKFDTLGVFQYHNHLDPTQTGTIEVVEAPDQPSAQ